jgi:hypothetical protein
MLHGASSWVRLADAVVLPNEDVDVEHSEGYRGVCVNPSNCIACPGGLEAIGGRRLEKVSRLGRWLCP